MLEADRMARAVLPRASSEVSFSILTSVYSRTPAQFFELTARSLLEQRHADFEWIVLENGPIRDDVMRVLDRIAADHRVQRFACAENAGIQGAMRQCLARAARRFVVPLDADDVLEPDALEVLAAAIDREQADFVFSDEDHLTGERVHTPYLRPGFDPVLNLESSYIWHLCAFSRERALELGVYSDEGAEYCHDWDTIVRFSEAGLRIAHVPHVLYHWRTHAESQSNTDTQNPGSVASMRAVVEAVLARRSAAERYEIAEFPLFRGAVEWWIRRRPIGDPGLAVVVLGATQADVDALAHVARPFDRQSRRAGSTTSGHALGLADARRRASPQRRTYCAARSSMSSDHAGVGVGGDEMVRAPAGRGDRGRPHPGRSRLRRRRRLSRYRRRDHGALPGSPSNGRRRICSCAEAADDRGASRGLSRRRAPLPGGRHRVRHA